MEGTSDDGSRTPHRRSAAEQDASLARQWRLRRILILGHVRSDSEWVTQFPF